jgi:hypothetical protein
MCLSTRCKRPSAAAERARPADAAHRHVPSSGGMLDDQWRNHLATWSQAYGLACDPDERPLHGCKEEVDMLGLANERRAHFERILVGPCRAD